MTDVKPAPSASVSPLFLRDEELRQGVDLLFFAMRDLNGEGDTLLKSEGLGRAHRRALYMIGRRPGLAVADLLAALKITKQSLNRVLNELLAKGHVESRVSPNDRRKRQLRLTEKGQALEAALWEAQRARVAKAFREAGPDAVSGFRKVLGRLADARPKPIESVRR